MDARRSSTHRVTVGRRGLALVLVGLVAVVGFGLVLRNTEGCHTTGAEDTARASDDPAHPAFMTVLLDGPVAAGSSFRSRDHIQPAVRYVIQEPDGSISHFFLDVGRHAPLFEHNDAVDPTVADLPAEERAVDFVIVSHLHTLVGSKTVDRASGGIRRLMESNPELEIYLPDPGQLEYEQLPPAWREIGLLERATILEPGFTAITDRVGVYATVFEESEGSHIHGLGWRQLQENLLLIRVDEGYYVHAVCAHLPTTRLDGRAVHPVELLQAELGDGIPAGAIHTLATGGCDARHYTHASGDGSDPIVAWMEGLRERVRGMQRIVLTHCGRNEARACEAVYGDACLVASSGSTLELSP